MPSTRSFVSLIILLVCAFRLYSQEWQPIDTLSDASLQNVIEDVVSQREAWFDFADFNTQGLFAAHGRININKATDKQLRRLQLNEMQIAKLREYTGRYGELSGVYELNLVEGFDSALIMQISPLISFELEKELNVITARNLVKKGRHTVITRYGRDLETAEGYLTDSSGDAAYAGNPDRLLVKYTYNYYDRLKVGFTVEKDAGESMKNGFDYSAWHLLYKSRKFIRTLAAGKYNLRFGQGLTLNTGFNPGYNISYPVFRSLNNSLSANTGANEGMGLSGVAATVKPLKGIYVTAFYSLTKPDAGINHPDSSETGYFTGLNETGLHRTLTEISRKKAIEVKAYGGNVRFSRGLFSVGATGFTTEFSELFESTDKPYELFDFTGRKLINFGSDFSFSWKTLNVFGEISGSDNGGMAYITGVNLTPSSECGISVSWHDYSPDYTNFFSGALSEGNGCKNEKGLYAVMQSGIGKHFTLTANASQYTFPWLKYRIDAPAYGSRYALQLKYRWYSINEVLVRFSYQKKLQNLSGTMSYDMQSQPIDYPLDFTKYAFRFNLQYKPHPSLILSNRIEYLVNENPHKKTTRGYLLYQDLNYAPANSSLSIHLRYAMFETETYDDRIYAYESDVLYTWSVPAYYYKGSKYFVLLHYKASRSTSLWLKYSNSFYPGRNSMGTGHEKVAGNTVSELKIQLIVKI